MYVPITYSLTDLVRYYIAHLSLKIDSYQFLFYIDGNTYIPFKDDSQEEIELKDPANSLTQSLVNWLKQNKYCFELECKIVRFLWIPRFILIVLQRSV